MCNRDGHEATKQNAAVSSTEAAAALPTGEDRLKEKVDETSSARKKPAQSGRDLGVWEESLEDRANIVSIWLLTYLTPLLRLGAYKVLEQDDIGVPSKADLADRSYQVAHKAWTDETEKCKLINAAKTKAYEDKLAACSTDEQRKKIKAPVLRQESMAAALMKGFGVWTIVYAIMLYVLSSLLQFVPVLILNDLVKFFQTGGDASIYNGYAPPWVEVFFLGFVPFLVTLLQGRNQVIFAHCSVFVRTGVSTMLYRKSLCVSASGRAQTSTGQIVNLMSVDTTQL
jgi:hypothetical protein